MDSQPNEQREPMFRIKKWNLVATWEWIAQSEMCAICRLHVMEACSECRNDEFSNPDDCEIVWGECNHSFHSCCISQWTRKSKRCPLCQHEWKNCKSHKIDTITWNEREVVINEANQRLGPIE